MISWGAKASLLWSCSTFFSHCGLGSSWIEADGLLEAILFHGEVGDSCPLLFVEEVVVCDGQEGHLVD